MMQSVEVGRHHEPVSRRRQPDQRVGMADHAQDADERRVPEDRPRGGAQDDERREDEHEPRKQVDRVETGRLERVQLCDPVMEGVNPPQARDRVLQAMRPVVEAVADEDREADLGERRPVGRPQ